MEKSLSPDCLVPVISPVPLSSKSFSAISKPSVVFTRIFNLSKVFNLDFSFALSFSGYFRLAGATKKQ